MSGKNLKIGKLSVQQIWKFILLIILIVIANKSIGQGVQLYNPQDSTYKFQLWQVEQIQRDIEERKLLVDEVINKKDQIIILENTNTIYLDKIINDSIAFSIVTQDRDQYKEMYLLQKGLYNLCITLNGRGENSIKGLEIALKNQKRKNLWLKLTSGGSVVIVAILVRELLIRR